MNKLQFWKYYFNNNEELAINPMKKLFPTELACSVPHYYQTGDRIYDQVLCLLPQNELLGIVVLIIWTNFIILLAITICHVLLLTLQGISPQIRALK